MKTFLAQGASNDQFRFRLEQRISKRRTSISRCCWFVFPSPSEFITISTTAETGYICADQAAIITFRLQHGGGPFIRLDNNPTLNSSISCPGSSAQVAREECISSQFRIFLQPGRDAPTLTFRSWASWIRPPTCKENLRPSADCGGKPIIPV